MKTIIPLEKAQNISLYGAKAVGLGDAIRKGIPVPSGIALSGDLVNAISSNDKKAIKELMDVAASISAPFAVRSSVIDEDGKSASFAGQHLTKLNVHSVHDLPDAIREVWWSANSDSAITYRKRIGLFTQPSVGVVIQTLLKPDVSGVMFTENPITGADECMIEASYGLGEAVVSGLVIPDLFRIDRAGQILERKAGHKQIAIRPLPHGGTFEEELPSEKMNQICLNDHHLLELTELALLCEKVYGSRRDIEWAIQDDKLFLLQCRSITTGINHNDAPLPPVTHQQEPAEALQRVPLFSDMERNQVDQIVRLLKLQHFAKGETLIVEGSGGSVFYMIESGTAVVKRKGKQISKLGPGDFFGELSLIDGEPRSATIIATSDMTCYGLTFWEFRPLLDRNPVLAWKIIEKLTKILRKTLRDNEELSSKYI